MDNLTGSRRSEFPNRASVVSACPSSIVYPMIPTHLFPFISFLAVDGFKRCRNDTESHAATAMSYRHPEFYGGLGLA